MARYKGDLTLLDTTIATADNKRSSNNSLQTRTKRVHVMKRLIDPFHIPMCCSMDVTPSKSLFINYQHSAIC